jgi:hypothetical protein
LPTLADEAEQGHPGSGIILSERGGDLGRRRLSPLVEVTQGARTWSFRADLG